ncbi:MAG: carbon-nitrogen hydrolase family protein [Bryobacteraceae bacterium]
MEDVRVAAVAVDSRPGEVEQNLEKIGRWCARAAAEGARLVLFQELSLTGFVPNHPVGDHAAWLREALQAARRMAQPVDGPAVEGLTAIAKANGLWVAAGLLEDAGNLLHNTHVLAGPGGVVGTWRKLHVPMFEMPFYNGGAEARAAETPFGRVGVNICFDALLPESTRLLAVDGVDIVLFPFAADPTPVTPQGWAAWAGPALRARCVENGVFGLASNYTGRVECAGVTQEFPGGGMAIGPRGEVLADWTGEPGESAMLLADFRRGDLTAARAEPEYLYRFRRPELYGPLTRGN